ncbi:GNAT family N-acetyltransferase [Streptomyces sp. NBC_00083]|uniref:GNAT family N-acetyltransferase n=1 Tax=Streptomyces sp. NBC_00083 TaxID=2975647 RepID=UPI00225184C6|nr:GNAT family N-acetyltransferase [Streptomyces sp. NBC_00083]MCX5382828.1 GNAT family N-acetyltransferase [Streptomyces sp. NBC_00083]
MTHDLARDLADGLALDRAGERDLAALTALYDGAARWMREHGIDQWQPGGKDAAHFRLRMEEGEVWLARIGAVVVGAYELWWRDEQAWGARPPVAGYVHRLMVDRATAPRGTGRALLAHAEGRIAGAGLALCRLDCRSDNPVLLRYYEGLGYAVVGELKAKTDGGGSPYAVTLMERALPAR